MCIIKKLSHCSVKCQSKKRIVIHFEQLCYKKKRRNTPNDYNRKSIVVQRWKMRCHFRRRSNSLPAGNFRSQRWIRKLRQLLFSLYCYYTRVHSQRGMLQKSKCVCVYICIYIYMYIYTYIFGHEKRHNFFSLP